MSAHPHRKLFLLDAMALIYRAYYGLGSNFLYNSKGMNTTAISVFTDSLMKMLNEEKPTHIAVAFDSLAPTQRDAVYAEYKANRQAIPEDIKNSIPWIKEILKALKIPILEFEGYEADDIIGTIAKKAEKKGFEVYMVTPDKDFGQLVTDKIKIYKPSFRGKPPEILGQKEIQEKWQIDDVKKVTDILGLMGDSVDNIPGIKGIGEKTAIKLIQEFGSLENLLAHTGKLTGRLKENVEQHADEARLSKQLATIVTDLPIEVDEQSFALSDPDRQKLAAIFAELEFRTLGKRILGESYSPNVEVSPPLPEGTVSAEEQPLSRGRNIHNTTHHYVLAGNQALLDELTDKLTQAPLVSLKVETDDDDVHNSKITGLSFVFKPQEGYYLPVKNENTRACGAGITQKGVG
ncbi:MAG: hypothetical protein KatS3mg031_1353 [Chitinophagales bacterium]|nr:MAG: hypothetical protein KatS3mg031_1353 [Chitinophagales bacterium]